MSMKKLVKIEANKNLYFLNQINNFLDPTYIYLPTNNKEFKENDYIYKNMLVEDNISSISGSIKSIKNNILQIKNDYKENSVSNKRKRNIKNKDDLLNLLEEFHLLSLKDKIKNQDITHLVVSAIDEECYSLKEFMILANFYTDIASTLNTLLNTFNIKEGIIATKDTSEASIKNIKSILGTYPQIKLSLVPNQYLISREVYLCSYLNMPINNTLILTMQDVLDITNALKGKYTLDTIITISGNNLVKSLIINVRIGTLLKEVINKFIEIKENDYDIFVNGLLQGYKVPDFNVIITKDIHTIVINKKIEVFQDECINCGACIKICPLNINVKKCFKEKRYSKKCFGCGLCNYICPANLPLKEVVKDGAYEEKNN